MHSLTTAAVSFLLSPERVIMYVLQAGGGHAISSRWNINKICSVRNPTPSPAPDFSGSVGRCEPRAFCAHSRPHAPRAEDVALQRDEMSGRCVANRGGRIASVERHKPSIALNRKSKQLYVRNLPRTMDPRRVENPGVKDARLIRPEFMPRLAACLG